VLLSNGAHNDKVRSAAVAFELFQKGSAPLPSVPSVTIQKRGLFSLNDAAQSLIGTPEAIQFLWDSERRLIGLKPVPINTPNAYPARRMSASTRSSNHGPVIGAGTMFTKFIELDTSKAHRWIPRLEDGLLIIDLNDPGTPVSSNRGRKSNSTEN
jgi:hypothetical protein